MNETFRIIGRLIKKDHQGLLIQVYDNKEPNDTRLKALEIGKPIKITYHTKQGIFAFETKILANQSNELKLDHAFHKKKIQRQQYFRKNIHLNAQVRKLKNKADYICRLYDLSAGGASIKNHRFQVGDTLILTMNEIPNYNKTVYSTVVRLSNAKKVAHLQFLDLSDQDKDKLIQYNI